MSKYISFYSDSKNDGNIFNVISNVAILLSNKKKRVLILTTNSKVEGQLKNNVKNQNIIKPFVLYTFDKNIQLLLCDLTINKYPITEVNRLITKQLELLKVDTFFDYILIDGNKALLTCINAISNEIVLNLNIKNVTLAYVLQLLQKFKTNKPKNIELKNIILNNFNNKEADQIYLKTKIEEMSLNKIMVFTITDELKSVEFSDLQIQSLFKSIK